MWRKLHAVFIPNVQQALILLEMIPDSGELLRDGTPLIEPERVRELWANGTEDQCRRYAKGAIDFLTQAHGHLLRLRYLEANGRQDELVKLAGVLLTECDKIGALRMAAGCRLLRKEATSAHLSLLEDEFAATERRLAEISRSLGIAAANKGRARRRRTPTGKSPE